MREDAESDGKAGNSDGAKAMKERGQWRCRDDEKRRQRRGSSVSEESEFEGGVEAVHAVYAVQPQLLHEETGTSCTRDAE